MDLITRGNKVIMETYKRFPLVFDKGQGCVLTDHDGKEYLDFVAGIAVDALGHSHPGLLAAMQAQRGRTTILISHRFSTVSMADRIIVLDQRHVVESGTHQELQARQGTYANLYNFHRYQMEHEG